MKSQVNTAPRLFVHGHSCCEIRFRNVALICDPWLLGSAYWRSWWNFPPQSDLGPLLEEWAGLDQVFVYITHLHWDHFHGPTIRRIAEHCANVHFLLPLTPEKRLSNDLSSIVKRRPVLELVHGLFYRLTSWLHILSFQSGPFFADSALFVKVNEITILNANDSKLSRFALSDLLRKTGKPRFVLRSHSSANYRAYKRNLDGSEYKLQPDKANESYSLEFIRFAAKAGASYAIPFASNMAYLHKDTFAYNKDINSSDMVVEYCSSHLRCSSPLPLPLPLLLLPGESLDLHSSKVAESQRARQLMVRDRLEALSDYALSKSACLHQQYLIESTSELNYRAINKYFTGVIRSCPFVIKYILGDHVYIHAKPGSVICFIRINFKKAELHFCSTPPVFGPRDVCFVIHPYVLSDLCANRHFNSLGVSKRLEVWAAPGNPRDAIFNYLCNTYEAEGALSRHVIRSPRFWSVWLRRLPELFDLMLSVLLVLAQRSWHTRA